MLWRAGFRLRRRVRGGACGRRVRRRRVRRRVRRRRHRAARQHADTAALTDELMAHRGSEYAASAGGAGSSPSSLSATAGQPLTNFIDKALLLAESGAAEALRATWTGCAPHWRPRSSGRRRCVRGWRGSRQSAPEAARRAARGAGGRFGTFEGRRGAAAKEEEEEGEEEEEAGRPSGEGEDVRSCSRHV